MAERFPDSRRKAYYLMAIHENLNTIPKQRKRYVKHSFQELGGGISYFQSFAPGCGVSLFPATG
ncbi:MAG: hypothetical protein DMG54_30070 [Acidobacteria bacterium]|nr:MAG: hypothetical protein DMG54_30070 [Acidobacteriota bacterium]PYU69546.1 MAG: hypothetical protein DMG52_28615 [Acidobacteriota bacterium]